MRRQGILNPQLLAAITVLGHTESLVIADPGLPLPANVPVIDLSLLPGIPSFFEVLDAVLTELVVEQYVVAEEVKTVSPQVYQDIAARLPGLKSNTCPHEEFKQRLANVKCIVRTGETTPFANIILIGGVNF